MRSQRYTKANLLYKNKKIQLSILLAIQDFIYTELKYMGYDRWLKNRYREALPITGLGNYTENLSFTNITPNRGRRLWIRRLVYGCSSSAKWRD